MNLLVSLAVLVVSGALRQEPEAALGALRAAAERNPYEAAHQERLAFALRAAGDVEGSVAPFERAAELSGNAWGYLYNVACVHAALGERETALDWLERCLDAGLTDDELILREPDFELELALGDGRRERFSVARAELGLAAFSEQQFGSLGRKRSPEWVFANDWTEAELPLHLRTDGGPLWWTDIPEQKLVYFGFGVVGDAPGTGFESFCRRLFEHIAETGAERLVLDMRWNDGGNTGAVLPLIHGLIRCDAVNQPGHLFVITGRRTFSAAMNTCSLLELHTAATFVGEPTGSCPNFVGESTSFVLPCTRYRVYCSSRYWQLVSSTDRRPWIAPELVVEPSFEDWVARRDPVLDAILERCP